MAMLPPDRWQALQARLDEALELPATARSPWLAALRETEPALVRDLEGLLLEHEAVCAEGFLESPNLPLPGADRAGQAVGAYTLLSPIGEGGMGTVWLAERSDGRFARRAAVKLPRVALLDQGAERFKRETQILARLAHPHIARLIDAGVSDAGRPYLVLEHVDGVPLDRYCDERRLSVEARVRLFLDVLQAVSHAHANLVVHRDIKPSNVLVTPEGHVTLLDFGVAKLLDDEGSAGEATLLTREFGTALTLEYAAPEQVTDQPVSTATDVYSLGVLLFVLLAGQHPAGPGPHSHADLVRAIVDVDPPRPSDVAPPGLKRALEGDLDTIVGTALKKAPAARYASVSAFAEDLRRYLALQPILARPDTFRYRAATFARRNRAPVALAIIGLLATLAGLVGTVIQARRASAERDFAVYQLARAEAVNDLDQFVLTDAAPGRALRPGDLLARAEHLVERRHATGASRVDLLVTIGRQYWALDEQAAATRVLAEAYRLSKGLVEPSARARAACALATELARTPQSDRAEALFNEGMADLPADARFARDQVFCLQCGSAVARERGAQRDAIARAEKARSLLPSLPFDSDVLDLRVLMDVAESYRMAGRQREAAAAFGEASTRLTAAGRDETLMATTLFNNWAMTLYQLGRPLDSERLFRRAIEISREDAGDSGVSPMLMINYGRVLAELSRLDEAADYAKRGQAKAEQFGDQVIVNQGLLLRAGIYRLMHDARRASAMLDEVEPRLRQALPPSHIAFASLRMQRALAAREAGDAGKALRLADQAVDLTRAAVAGTAQSADLLPLNLTRRAEIEMDLGRPREAESDAREAARLLAAAAEPETRSSSRGRAYLVLGRALVASGRSSEAREELRRAAEHLRSALGADHPDTRLADQLIQSTR